MQFPSRFIIAADISTLSPLTIAAVEKGSVQPDTGRISRYSSKTGVQCGLTRTMRLADQAQSRGVAQTDEESTSLSRVHIPEVPVIPASTLGGILRRKAADLIFQSLVQRGHTLSVDAYNTLTSGTATTSLSADAASPEVVFMARRDAFLANFGGTSFALDAKSVIATGWPLLESTRDKLMSEPLAQVLPFTQLHEMTSAVSVIRKNDAADVHGKQLEAVVGREALCSYLDTENQARAASKARKKSENAESGTKTDLRTFNAVEAVDAGMNFALRIGVTALSPAQLGLMLLSLQELLREGQIGGKAARGFGQFVCSASRLYLVDPQTRQKSIHGSIFTDRENGYSFLEDALLDQAIEAGQDYLDSVDPKLIEAFASTDAKAIKATYKAAA